MSHLTDSELAGTLAEQAREHIATCESCAARLASVQAHRRYEAASARALPRAEAAHRCRAANRRPGLAARSEAVRRWLAAHP
jgi:anti-sigma factor RsiW